ncbi:hypothetical protein GCM10029976_026250 [Kribbella albertanoniae]
MRRDPVGFTGVSAPQPNWECIAMLLANGPRGAKLGGVALVRDCDDRASAGSCKCGGVTYFAGG